MVIRLLSSLFLIASLLFTVSMHAQWESVASLPMDERHHPVTFSIDGIGYVLTGSTPSTFATNDFARYIPDMDAWETMDDFPGPARSFSYGIAYEGKGYVGFGRNLDQHLNEMWSFDPQTGEWNELAVCPCQGRTHPAFLEAGGVIYVGLGNNNGDLKDWWAYTIANDSWKEIAEFPGPQRHHPYQFTIDDVPYAGFGHHQSDIYNTFYRYNVEDDTWTQMNDFPGEGRVAGTQFSYNGKGYVLSGQGEDHTNFEVGEFWEYDPLTDSWEVMPSHPGSGRWAPGSFLIENEVYFLAGRADEGDKNDMMRYILPLSPTSVFEVEAEEINIYPNPVSNEFSISGNDQEVKSLEIRNTVGQVVLSLSNPGKTVYTADLSSGTYFVSMVMEDDSLSVGRFIKK